MSSDRTRIDRVWNGYWNILLRCPFCFLLISSAISITLMGFLFDMHVRPFDQIDFFIPTGSAMKNAERIRKIFGNDMDQRVHQQINLYPALDVIIRRKIFNENHSDDDKNMLNEIIVDEVCEK